MLVIKGNDTPRELVRRAHDRLTQTRAQFLGVLVNNVDLTWGDPYFYESYYGYRATPEAAERARAGHDGFVEGFLRQHGLAPVAASAAGWVRGMARLARGREV